MVKKDITERIKVFLSFFSLFGFKMKYTVLAALSNDKVVTGTKNLVSDATTVLQTVGISVCVIAAIYFFIRKSNADEQDQKIWKNRIGYAIIAAIGITVASGLLTTITSYYK